MLSVPRAADRDLQIPAAGEKVRGRCWTNFAPAWRQVHVRWMWDSLSQIPWPAGAVGGEYK